ncbi:hypothetical protein A1O7_05506 [Cladophialophora yegresii CBS 114405]|uniref:BZIP domain-containing protein n=1 Tax=Cladophialophora yegresii CBS 114405 TaxID=1182544 RepID=W9VQS4_9EURO|nr:uncharacterized protein A1O7_05506 [Cladophialophora yegresii CBS 114405]EXJ58082.1 hypothetical protein A1O7_05506 [Cladophialophora yegresii CBS 114405]
MQAITGGATLDSVPSRGKDNGPAERRKQQNRIAQRRYRDKIASRTKTLEAFAQQARQLLSDAVDLELEEPRCPECSHCRGLENNHEADTLQVVDEPTPPQACHRDAVMGSFTLSDGASQENPPTIPAGISRASTRNSYLGEPRTPTNSSLACLQDDLGEGRAAHTGVPMTPNQSLTAKPREDAGRFGALHTPLSDQTFADYMDLSGLGYLDNHTNAVILTPSDEPLQPTLTCEDSVQASAALHLAAREGQTRILSILLRTGFRADSRDERGRTPLHHCASHSHTETAKVLLDAGASINAVDVDGTSVVMTAVKAGSERMVELLLSYKRSH